MADVSFDWASIVESIWVANKENRWFIIYGTNITWSFIHQYPACQLVNLNDYIDFSQNVPSNVEYTSMMYLTWVFHYKLKMVGGH